MKTVDVHYYAIFREQRGQSEEQLETSVDTAQALYQELSDRHHFSMPQESLKVVVNEEFCEWDCPLNNGDTIVFIPPVAGG